LFFLKNKTKPRAVTNDSQDLLFVLLLGEIFYLLVTCGKWRFFFCCCYSLWNFSRCWVFIKEICLVGGLTLLVDGFLYCVSG